MDRLKQKLSLNRKKKEKQSTSTKKSSQWQDDEKAVRKGIRSFDVKYLGCIEVQESRGIHVCEQAIQALLSQKGKHMKGILHVSGDALRVIDETKRGLIVDQTIEKVSFCAPDRFHEKGFAYICRDGTTRRWLCHGFLTTKETGERLSYTVGCAFQVCLERKQKRDQDCQVTAQYTQDGTSFTRFGSFRPVSLAQRIIDPQSALIAQPVPLTPSMHKSQHIERARPKGNYAENLNRSISMCSENFKTKLIGELKRHTSLRPYDLSSNKTIPEEDNEFNSTTANLSKISLFGSSIHYQSNEAFHSTSTISFPSPPFTNENLTSSFYSLNSPSIHSNQTSPNSINETLNPFFIQLKRSTNPFDDDIFQH